MPTIEQIESSIANFGESDTSFVGKEIKALTDVLAPNENVEAAVKGFYENHNWFMVCTRSRVIMLHKGMVSGLKKKEIPLSSISSIYSKAGIMWGEFTITVSGNELNIKQVSKKLVGKFVDVINEMRNKAKEDTSSTVPNTTTDQPDLIAQLEKLGNLKEKGLLSDDEFLLAKMKLLS